MEADKDIFKEGLLYLHGVKFGKRTWRKIWMIILKPRTLEIGRLEVYSLPDDVTEDMLPPPQDNTKRRVVLLSDCLSITLAPEEACPAGCTAFYLDTTLRTYTLASDACHAWLLALCQLTFQDPGEEASDEDDGGLLMKDNELYSGFCDQPEQHHVTVLDTEASERCLLAGDFTFLLDREAGFLLDKDTAAIIYRWPYMFLRRFGVLKGGFCIEAGHQCDSGEGMFSFLSPHGRQVCQAIAKQCWSEQEAMGEDSSPSSPPVCDFYKVLLNTVHPSSPPLPPHHHHEGEEGNLGARRLFRESQGDSVDAGGDKQWLPASTETRDQIVPSPPEKGHGADAVYSLVCFSEGDPSAAPPLHHHHSGHSSATTVADHHTPTPSMTPPASTAPVKPPRRAMRLSTKGTEKTEKKTKTTAAAGAGPLGDHSPSGPQSKGAPLSFKQKLSKLISIDLAKLQFPRRFGKGKS